MLGLVTAACGGLAAPVSAAGEDAGVLVGGGGRGTLGGGGISLVAGLCTLCTLTLCLGRGMGVVPHDGGLLLATSSATASAVAGGWPVVMGGV